MDKKGIAITFICLSFVPIGFILMKYNGSIGLGISFIGFILGMTELVSVLNLVQPEKEVLNQSNKIIQPGVIHETVHKTNWVIPISIVLILLLSMQAIFIGISYVTNIDISKIILYIPLVNIVIVGVFAIMYIVWS